MSQLTLTPASGSEVVSDGLMGLGGGILTELDLSKEVIGLEIGGLYNRRVYGDTASEYTETRAEVPVLLRLRFGDLGIGAGIYGALALGDIESDSGTATTYAAAGRETLDLGWVASAQYFLRFGAKGKTGIVIDGRYSRSLTNAASTDGDKGSYTNLQVLTGLRFDF